MDDLSRLFLHILRLFLKDAYLRFGLYNENFKIAADFDFYLRTILINKIKFKRVDQNYVFMRHGGESINLFLIIINLLLKF